MGIISNPHILLLAYRTIKSNKGATTLGSLMNMEILRELDNEQRKFGTKIMLAPDRMNLSLIKETSKLLRNGKYPWGVSKRIWVEKPGKIGKTRPLTIPPFFDRLIQAANLMILEAIYEPWFDKMNRSFGFRSNMSCHDSIVGLTSAKTFNMTIAMEGDLEKAYDLTNRNKLLEILGERIKDRKYLELIKKRLNYTFLDIESGKYETPKEGVQQGGIDSPYLYNIYLSKFDEWLNNYLTNLMNKLNKKVNKNVQRIPGRLRNSIKKKRTKLIKIELKKETVQNNKNEKYNTISKIRKLSFQLRQLPSIDVNKRHLRFYYTRYADDWILLLNGNKLLASQIKKEIAKYLERELSAKLSMEKTLITDLKDKNTPAHFLGFEMICTDTRKFALKRILQPNGTYALKLSKISGWQVKASPDKQRLINRMFMKNFCDKKGFPIGIPFLSGLEPYAIIERYNSIISGLFNYYTEFIYNKNKLNRWCYILRYSCLKTLAQKYRCTIKKLFKRYSLKDNQYTKKYGKTIEFKVNLTIKGKTFEKKWHLQTYKEAIDKAMSLNRKEELTNKFWFKEKPKSFLNFGYNKINKPLGRISKVTDDNFLEKIKWISWRTIASLSMPCSLCGTLNNVEMHHLKHIRKNKYSLIPQERTWEQIMNLRNRKQIPVCNACHIGIIHPGRYSGPKLINMTPKVLTDNRIIHIESYVKPGKVYQSKQIEEKGWKLLTKNPFKKET